MAPKLKIWKSLEWRYHAMMNKRWIRQRESGYAYAQLSKSRWRLADAQLPADDPPLGYLRQAWVQEGQSTMDAAASNPELELQARAAVMSLDAAEFSSRVIIRWTRWLVVATFILAAATGALIWVTAFPPHHDPGMVKVSTPSVTIIQQPNNR